MLSKAKCILDIHPQIPDRALNLRVAQQQLDGAQVSRRLIDYRRLRSPKRMRAVIIGSQADTRDPLVNKTGILPGADVPR
jgi:hypothetical protein